MFHTPTSEGKQQSEASRGQVPAETVKESSLPFGAISAHPRLRRLGTVLSASSAVGAPRSLAYLHRTYGNQAILRALSSPPPAIQTKLTINQPGDQYEQEADRVADQVMRMTDPPTLRRKCSACQEEDKIQRKCAECGEEAQKTELHRKQSAGGPQFAPPSVQAVLNSPGRPLDPGVRGFMEPRFGCGFSQVRVHTDARAAESARAVSARAYTVGRDIVFGADSYAPAASEGRKLIAHELTHVVQQRAAGAEGQSGQTRVAATLSESKLQTARLPCTSRKQIGLYAVNLPGSTRSLSDDLPNINSVLCQCGIEVTSAGGESWQTNVLDLDPPAGVLNASTSTPSRELSQMVSYRPGGNVIHVYYVPAISSGALAEGVGAARFSPPLPDSLIVSNSGGTPPIIAAHELGHVLLNDGSHHPNPDNLMAAGTVNTGAGELEQSQCDRMP